MSHSYLKEKYGRNTPILEEVPSSEIDYNGKTSFSLTVRTLC